MTPQKRLLVVLIVILCALVCLVLYLAQRPAAPFTSPQRLPSPIRTPIKPKPKIYRTFLPILWLNYRQTKKCVGLSIAYDADKMREVGANCTYAYGPNAAGYDSAADEVLGMVYPDAYTVTGKAPYFLGFNEPDLSLAVTPQMAAEMWPQVIAANPNKLAVSPAPSHLHPEWLAQFYTAHVRKWGYPPKLDALAIHCYNSANVCIQVVQQVIDYARMWNVPEVWVTEFAFSEMWQSSYPVGTTWQTEARKFIDWLDTQAIVTRYYWWALAYDSDVPAQWWSYGWHTQLYNFHEGGLNERGRFYQDRK